MFLADHLSTLRMKDRCWRCAMTRFKIRFHYIWNVILLSSHYLEDWSSCFCPKPIGVFAIAIDGERSCLNLSWFLSRRYYSATILQMSGVRDDKLAIWLAGLTTLTNFMFTLLGVWLVERVGRRKLTLGSILGRTSSTSTCGRHVFWGCYSMCLPSTGTCLSLSLLAVGFLMSAQHSPPVTLHPTSPSLANSTCSKYQWVASTHTAVSHTFTSIVMKC